MKIVVVTGRDTAEDRMAGLDAGADDYLVKRFAFNELSARLHALTRQPLIDSPREANR